MSAYNLDVQETLRNVEENDAELTKLRIGIDYNIGFNSTDGDDYSRLGAAIAENTHLTSLVVVLRDTVALDVTNDRFYDGLKLNSSIQALTFHCGNSNIAVGVGQKILEAYQENNNHLTGISINSADLQHGGQHIIAETLRSCTNLQHIDLCGCSITDEQLLPMVDAISGHRSLEELRLYGNRIGNTGCETLTTLLRNQNSNLQILNLEGNNIGNEGVTTLANGLLNNAKLRKLSLHAQPMDQSVGGIFARLLCNKSNINNCQCLSWQIFH